MIALALALLFTLAALLSLLVIADSALKACKAWRALMDEMHQD